MDESQTPKRMIAAEVILASVVEGSVGKVYVLEFAFAPAPGDSVLRDIEKAGVLAKKHLLATDGVADSTIGKVSCKKLPVLE